MTVSHVPPSWDQASHDINPTTSISGPSIPREPKVEPIMA